MLPKDQPPVQKSPQRIQLDSSSSTVFFFFPVINCGRMNYNTLKGLGGYLRLAWKTEARERSPWQPALGTKFSDLEYPLYNDCFTHLFSPQRNQQKRDNTNQNGV